MIRVLQALADHPTRWRYGYDLGNDVGLRSGSLYPLLVRLADHGLLEASWDSPVQGEVPRHRYRLTTAGLAARAAVPAASAAPAVRLQRRLWEASWV